MADEEFKRLARRVRARRILYAAVIELAHQLNDPEADTERIVEQLKKLTAVIRAQDYDVG